MLACGSIVKLNVVYNLGRVFSFISLSLLYGCGTTPQSDALFESDYATKFPATELTQTVFFPQEQYQCGPAALATVLNDSGVIVKPDELTPLVYIPKKNGTRF